MRKRERVSAESNADRKRDSLPPLSICTIHSEVSPERVVPTLFVPKTENTMKATISKLVGSQSDSQNNTPKTRSPVRVGPRGIKPLVGTSCAASRFESRITVEVYPSVDDTTPEPSESNISGHTIILERKRERTRLIRQSAALVIRLHEYDSNSNHRPI